MNIEEIRQLDKVVDRLAAAGPSRISAPHCWFCGKVGAVWFQVTAGIPGGSTCDCKKSQEAREGRRPKPRWNDKTKCIENLDAETIALNETLGYKVHTPPKVKPVPVTRAPEESVTPASVSVTPAEESVTPSRSAAAERQRRKRERDRAKQRGT